MTTIHGRGESPSWVARRSQIRSVNSISPCPACAAYCFGALRALGTARAKKQEAAARSWGQRNVAGPLTRTPRRRADIPQRASAQRPAPGAAGRASATGSSGHRVTPLREWRSWRKTAATVKVDPALSGRPRAAAKDIRLSRLLRALPRGARLSSRMRSEDERVAG